MKLYEITSNWLGVDLTLVSTRISFLNVLYLQNPLVTSHVVYGSEAHICHTVNKMLLQWLLDIVKIQIFTISWILVKKGQKSSLYRETSRYSEEIWYSELFSRFTISSTHCIKRAFVTKMIGILSVSSKITDSSIGKVKTT